MSADHVKNDDLIRLTDLSPLLESHWQDTVGHCATLLDFLSIHLDLDREEGNYHNLEGGMYLLLTSISGALRFAAEHPDLHYVKPARGEIDEVLEQNRERFKERQRQEEGNPK